MNFTEESKHPQTITLMRQSCSRSLSALCWCNNFDKVMEHKEENACTGENWGAWLKKELLLPKSDRIHLLGSGNHSRTLGSPLWVLFCLQDHTSRATAGVQGLMEVLAAAQWLMSQVVRDSIGSRTQVAVCSRYQAGAQPFGWRVMALWSLTVSDWTAKKELKESVTRRAQTSSTSSKNSHSTVLHPVHKTLLDAVLDCV